MKCKRAKVCTCFRCPVLAASYNIRVEDDFKKQNPPSSIKKLSNHLRSREDLLNLLKLSPNQLTLDVYTNNSLHISPETVKSSMS